MSLNVNREKDSDFHIHRVNDEEPRPIWRQLLILCAVVHAIRYVDGLNLQRTFLSWPAEDLNQ